MSRVVLDSKPGCVMENPLKGVKLGSFLVLFKHFNNNRRFSVLVMRRVTGFGRGDIPVTLGPSVLIRV